MALGRRLGLLPCLAILLVSCRFEEHAPGGLRPEDGAVRSLVAEFYQSVGARDQRRLERSVLPAATVLLSRPGGALLVPVRTMIDVPERRNEGGGVRIARVDLRPDGEVATARVVVVFTAPADQREFEATDFLTIAHREGAWRVAQAVFGPWRMRSAP
jgi:hypothetical protein